jgi:uncharacterized membrane protein
MENTFQPTELPKLELELLAIDHLKETRKWSSFLAILMFVLVGVMILMGIFMSLMMKNMPSPVPSYLFSVFYLVMAAIYVAPAYYLYQFSRLSKNAIQFGNTQSLTEALRYLKLHYRFIGILAIVVICIYAIALIVIAGVGAMGAMGQFN